MAKDMKIEAVIEGERSGTSKPFDFDDFITRKRQGKKAG
jgi:hypothetical protein